MIAARPLEITALGAWTLRPECFNADRIRESGLRKGSNASVKAPRAHHPRLRT